MDVKKEIDKIVQATDKQLSEQAAFKTLKESILTEGAKRGLLAKIIAWIVSAGLVGAAMAALKEAVGGSGSSYDQSYDPAPMTDSDGNVVSYPKGRKRSSDAEPWGGRSY